MSTTTGTADDATPGIPPMPDRTPKALRIAIAAHAPQLLVDFDRHWRRDVADAYDLTAVPAFMARWWSEFALARDPQLEAKVHRLEDEAERESDYARAKSLTEEAGRIRREAAKAELTVRGSTHATHPGELAPRPEATPEALREALAALAPHLLDEMQRAKDEALTHAVDASSTDPLHVWLLHWRSQIEILRRPDLVASREAAQRVIDDYDAGRHDDEGAVNSALKDLSHIHEEAAEAARS